MMKPILAILLSLPFCSFGQNKTGKFYINPNIIFRKSIQWDSPKVGASLSGGLLVRNFGIGAGVDYFKVYSDLKAATPIYLDLRYFFNSDNRTDLVPFVGANVGKMIWSASQTTGGPADNFTTGYKGKSYLGIESGIVLTKNRVSGFLASVGFKSYPTTRTGIHRSTIQPKGSIGPLTVTKQPHIVEKYSEVFLKIGYKF